MTTRKPRIDRFGQVHPPRRPIPVGLLLRIVILLAISVAASRGLQRLVASVEGYRPTALPQIHAGAGSTPLAQRAVLIIVSGLRDAAAGEMPALQQLGRSGVRATTLVPWPTITTAAWTTLLSGTAPELSGVVALYPTDDEPPLIGVDHLLSRARVTRRSVALAGHRSWQSMVPAGSVADLVVSPGVSTEDDARLVQQVVDILTARQPDLMVIQLSQVDTAGHAHGGASDEYFRATQRADALIGRLVSVVDLRHTVVAVTSDHGHLDRGGHGGPEAGVSTVPLVMAGPGLRPGDYGTIGQADVAPTLALLLGLPIPAHSEGAIRFEMLDASAPLMAEKAMALAEQQIRLTEAYLPAIGHGGTSGGPAQALAVARSAWAIGNIEGAFEIARQSEQDARAERISARTARIVAERAARLRIAVGAGALAVLALVLFLSRRLAWFVGAVLLAWLGPLGQADALSVLFGMPDVLWLPASVGAGLGIAALLWAWRSRRWGRLVAALAAVAAGAYFTLAQPAAFAPSAISSLESWRMLLAWRCAAGLLVGAAAVVSLAWPDEKDAGRIARSGYHFVFLLLAGQAVALAGGYWQLGSGVTWFLPDANLLYWQLMGVMQVMLVAGLGILLPAVAVPIALLLNRLGLRSAGDTRAQMAEARSVRP